MYFSDITSCLILIIFCEMYSFLLGLLIAVFLELYKFPTFDRNEKKFHF